MQITRRNVGLMGFGITLGAPGLALAQGPAAPADARLGVRSTGQATAPVTVIEFFSLTCGHCAAFHNQVWPRVKTELVNTGRMRMVWRDFPLDGVALAAAAIARALPEDRYEAFIGTLFQTQDRWAFAQGRQIDELARIAALAGMDRARFDAVLADEALRRGILEQRMAAEREFQIRATPSFAFNGRLHSGNLPFEQFARLVQDAPKT
ncbi:DsbA family protein [Sediminicoccus sp. BL-A-41-H5]|uniref:DsbA family protein n=1 Tax=Sediminicoccus sp. BL-A-41-H5 TaxID=3421106 RepID=UPI003D6720BC